MRSCTIPTRQSGKVAPKAPATLVALAMVAFAGNSLLCRVALKSGSIDAASFTTVRLAVGALMLGGLITALGGIALLDEAATWSLGMSALAIVGGLFLLLRGPALHPRTA